MPVLRMPTCALAGTSSGLYIQVILRSVHKPDRQETPWWLSSTPARPTRSSSWGRAADAFAYIIANMRGCLRRARSLSGRKQSMRGAAEYLGGDSMARQRMCKGTSWRTLNDALRAVGGRPQRVQPSVFAHVTIADKLKASLRLQAGGRTSCKEDSSRLRPGLAVF